MSLARTIFTKTILLAAAAASLTTLEACGTFRVVKKVPNGGEVALDEGRTQASREKAEQYMAQQCGAGYDVLEEGEAVIGEDTTSQTQSGRGRSLFGGSFGQSNTNSSTVQKSEWRIKFQCKGTGAPAAPAAAPAAPKAAETGAVHEVRYFM